ncbi:hypothetical protein ACMX1E_06060 [Bartonella bacilliformis]|uniref:hypothetical protein n=1 Tax=Bartonella bacilliformis TaxID=774 RepID=UPI000448A032|nr:hypothetical protein [Bartonella bacilliformis]EYS95755.1 hypothetical protein X470_00347 [Bartonella bacilliformis Peru-18]KEG18102.1 hypothetical protein H709_00240 [Bartonella bacilliformis CUSCO5]
MLSSNERTETDALAAIEIIKEIHQDFLYVCLEQSATDTNVRSKTMFPYNNITNRANLVHILPQQFW